MLHKKIKNGAFIVSDAHYSHRRVDFFYFLLDILDKKLKPSQLILMGDIFDSIMGGISKTIEVNKKEIEMLNSISEMMEVVYLEGNHDFNMKKIFKNIEPINIKNQPVAFVLNNKQVLLAHGDIENELTYRVYTSFIRNKITLFFLNLFNFLSFNYLYKKLNEYLHKKDDCRDFVGFRAFVEKRLIGKYRCDYFIEGHYHQNKFIDFKDFKYINLGAFACDNLYYEVNFNNKDNFLSLKNYKQNSSS